MAEQDQPHRSRRASAPGENLPALDRFMGMTIPMLFRAIGMLMGKHGMGHILLKVGSS
jgi:hypothetical protein